MRVAQLPELASSHPRVVAEQVVIDQKYAGYVARQQTEVDRQSRLAEKRIPDSFRLRPYLPASSGGSREALARSATEPLRRPVGSAASRRPTWHC